MSNDLIKKLEALTGPDRWADWSIADYLNEIPEHKVMSTGWDDGWFRRPDEVTLRNSLDCEGRRITTWSPELYTSSVDAAIALARRLWPDMMYRIGNDGEGSDPSLFLGEMCINGEYYTGISSVEAISLCIAILKAKEAIHDA